MHTMKRKKRNRGIGKGLASLLMVTLLVNQISVPVFAEEIRNAVCLCDVRCSVDHVNEACVVCVENYEKCEAAETGSDNFTDDNPEDSGSNEDVNTDTDTNVTPDDDADDDPEDSGSNGDGNTDADTNVTPDDGADDDSEGSDSDEDVNADADIVADIKTENVFAVDDETEAVMEEESVSPDAEGDTFTDGAFTYTVMSEDENNRQVELTGPVEGTAVSGDLVIPATASDGTNEYAVVKIGGSAFKDCSSVTSVVIPDSVTTIWGSAFYNCTGMTNITIPDSVTTIRGSAFYNCNSLTSIHIPKGVTIINRLTFRYCRSLKSVIIPEGVTSIGNSAFGICDSLESVIIPDSVTVIENNAFGLCKSLRSVIIPRNVTSLGAASFGFVPSLESVTILNDHISFGDGAFIETNLSSFQIAVSENITATPTVGILCFRDVPLGEDTYLTFLTEDGTRELNHTTTPTLAEAVEAYNAVDDGGINDGYWYGWRLPEVPEVTGYPVTIHVNKDGAAWEDCAKEFVLSADNGVTFITDLTDVANGNYTIYEITGTADNIGYVNTGVSVAVADAAAEATIDYYTVTFYSDGTVFDERVVRNNENVSAPSATPTKDGYTFYRWVTSEGGTTEFHFENPITAKTDIYAGWIENEKETFTIIASAGDGGSVSPSGEVKVKSGDDQQFIMTPKTGYRIASVLVDGSEVLSREQTAAEAKAGISDGENNTKYYVFENVTGNHTLAAYFEAIQPDDNPPDGGDKNPDKPGGSGGGDKNPDEPGGGGGNSPEEPDGGDGNKNPDEPDGGNGDGGGNNADDSEVSRSTFNSDTNVMPKTDTVRHGDDRAPGSGNSEPKTGDATGMEIYATIAMVAGLAYLLLYFADGKNGMTEEEKKETVAALIRWAKRGKRLRKYAALAAIFLILVYYHSIGKRTAAEEVFLDLPYADILKG